MARKCSKCGFEPPPEEGYRLQACPECNTPYIAWEAKGFASATDAAVTGSLPKSSSIGLPVDTPMGEGMCARLSADIDRWGADHAWPWRGALWIFCIYTAVRYSAKWDYHGLFGGINFGIHELGHVVIFFNKFLHFAAGTFFQVAAPIVGFFMFYWQREYFGLSVAGVWLATNLYYVAWYMSSAHNPGSITLIAPWANPKHDWTYLFQKTGLLKYNRGIASATRLSAHILIWVSIAFGAWVLWKMIRADS
jgi:hypothetical protein